jgi:hypothetical protein
MILTDDFLKSAAQAAAAGQRGYTMAGKHIFPAFTL